MSTVPIPMLANALKELAAAANNMIQESKIKNLGNTIQTFAIASAVASAAAGVVPGLAGTLAAIAQTGLVWSLYVKINKELGISIKKETAKFIASAIVTNLIANAGAIILALIASSILSLIPGGGVIINATLGYVIIYACAILYLQLLTKVMKAKGTIEFNNDDETKNIIKNIVKDADLKGIVKEGKENFKTVDLDEARKNPTCPSCSARISLGQKFCSNCGASLSKID